MTYKELKAIEILEKRFYKRGLNSRELGFLEYLRDKVKEENKGVNNG